MNSLPLTPRQIEEIKSMGKKLSHRPTSERAAFIREFLKLKVTEAEIVKALSVQE